MAHAPIGLLLLGLCGGVAGRTCVRAERAAEGPAELNDAIDAFALVQAAVLAHEGRAKLGTATAQKGAAARWSLRTFSCADHPHGCEAPFNCDTIAPLEPLQWGWSGYAGGKGRANTRVWCSVPEYLPYMHQCLVRRDLVEAARLQFQATEAGHFGPLTMENDGSYCFLEGHCADKTVDVNTTLDDAEKLCDQRFGRDRWTQYGSLRSPSEDHIGFGGLPNASRGFFDRRQTTPFVLASCAMGNYHCDVMYCKETYCKSEYYKNRYGHLLPQGQ